VFIVIGAYLFLIAMPRYLTLQINDDGWAYIHGQERQCHEWQGRRWQGHERQVWREDQNEKKFAKKEPKEDDDMEQMKRGLQAMEMKMAAMERRLMDYVCKEVVEKVKASAKYDKAFEKETMEKNMKLDKMVKNLEDKTAVMQNSMQEVLLETTNLKGLGVKAEFDTARMFKELLDDVDGKLDALRKDVLKAGLTADTKLETINVKVQAKATLKEFLEDALPTIEYRKFLEVLHDKKMDAEKWRTVRPHSSRGGEAEWLSKIRKVADEFHS
jgi:hypothetical protein